jgi:hypothetical protein
MVRVRRGCAVNQVPPPVWCWYGSAPGYVGVSQPAAVYLKRSYAQADR